MKRKPQRRKAPDPNDPFQQFKLDLPGSVLSYLEKVGRPNHLTRQDIVRSLVVVCSKVDPQRFFSFMGAVEKLAHAANAEAAAAKSSQAAAAA